MTRPGRGKVSLLGIKREEGEMAGAEARPTWGEGRRNCKFLLDKEIVVV
jgi:hypothetical protein